MTTNSILHQNIEPIHLKDDKNEIFKNMINYFELTPKTLDIKIPYKFNNALDILKNINTYEFSSDLKEIIKIKEENNILNDDINFSIDNVKFLTSKLSDNDKTDYILLKDLKKEEFIKIPEFSGDYGEYIDKGINLNIKTREDSKKEINIKCIINYKNFMKNIIENLINKSQFNKARNVLEESNKYINDELTGKNLEFEMKIYSNSINKIIYTENGEFLFDLQFPPLFKTNFLINKNKSYEKLKSKNRRNDYTYYENIFFPFRNFEDEIANLKYKHFYI